MDSDIDCLLWKNITALPKEGADAEPEGVRDRPDLPSARVSIRLWGRGTGTWCGQAVFLLLGETERAITSCIDWQNNVSSALHPPLDDLSDDN